MLLSEENLRMHTEYARQLRLKYSILEKSEKRLVGKELLEIPGLKIEKSLREEAYGLLCETILHEVFFDSVSEIEYKRSELAERDFGTVGGFLNHLYRLGMKMSGGFISIGIRKGRIRCDAVSTYGLGCLSYNPILAIDLCEHSYFLDYGFDKGRYLYKVIPHLNLDKLDKVKL